MPGPKPKPTDELTSWRADLEARRAEVKAEVLAECPGCPPYLTGRARYFWKRLAPALHEERILTALDLPALGLLCRREADVERLEQLTAGRDAYVFNDMGARANPLWRALHEAVADCRRLYDEFGMTPKARIGLPSSKKTGKVLDASGHFPKG